MSLQELAIAFFKQTGYKISKEGLNKRFTKEAVVFMKEILNRLLQKKLSEQKLILNACFDGVLIKDATSFQLPRCMKNNYKGSGGAGSDACIKIQFEYDAFTGQITSLELYPFVHTDQKTAKEDISSLKNNFLYLRDLGYMTIDFINGIKQYQAFYLGRLNTNMNVFIYKNEKKKRICFKSIYRYMNKHGLERMEMNVWLTSKLAQTRLIIEMLPEEIVENRLRNKYKEAKKKGKNVSKETITRASLNLFITNTNQEQCPIENVRKVYQIRWQIELIFKAFKSKLAIDKVNRKMKTERFECFLLARLIWIVFHFSIYHYINNQTWKKHKRLTSIYKFFSYCKVYIEEFVNYYKNNRLEEYITELIKCQANFNKEKRKNRDNLDEIFIMIFQIVNNQKSNILS